MSPYSRRALFSSRSGSTRCGAPTGETCTCNAGILAHEHARGARVVEVDVREQEMADVGQLQAARRETGFERVDARRRPAVEQRRPVRRVEEIARDNALATEMEQVDGFGRRHALILCGRLL